MENSKTDSQQLPMVSICTTTYNRGKYIGQAIESCMMQKTNFQFDMIICDNCSTDNTVAVIESYIQKYPGKIKLLKADKNYGLMINYIKSIEAGTGKYIADCDGDDYWTDEYKLQKQVDFLESNPDFVMCFTNTMQLNTATGKQNPAKEHIWDVATTSELLTYNSIGLKDYPNDIHCPGHVSSIVFRNNILKFPDWYKDCYINDEPLFLMLSKYGKAKFLNEMMTVYRMTPTGYSSFDFSHLRDWKGRIHFYKKIDEFFDGQFKKEIAIVKRGYNLKISKFYFKSKQYIKSVGYLLKSFY